MDTAKNLNQIVMNYDRTKYKVWTWKNPVMLHWIINPGLAVGELLFGQRIPKVTLVERNSEKALSERTFIPCPHCGTYHSGLKWSRKNKTALKNWFGLYCDNCEKIIPCLTNLTSLIILGITFPVWFWFKDKWKAKWLEEQKIKFSKPLDLTYPQHKNQWLLSGLFFGFFMFVLIELLCPLIKGETFTQKRLLIGIITCSLAGLFFGVSMKIINRKKKIKTHTE